MKVNRIMRVTAIILILAMMPLWILGCGRVDAKVSDRLVDFMTGDGSYDKKSESGKAFLAQVNAEATEVKGAVNAEDFWDKTPTLENEDRAEVRHYRNLYILAKAWATKGSKYYHKMGVMKTIKNGLEYGYDNFYGEKFIGKELVWWDSAERINIADYLIRTLLILSENHRLGNKKVEKYKEIVDVKFPYSTGSAVDRERVLYILIASAALSGDTEKIKEITEKSLSGSFSFVTSGDGLYADGSYLANNSVASSGSYGVMAFSTLVELTYALNGTKADLKEEVGAISFLYNWAKKSIIPSLYNGSAIATTTGSYLSENGKMGGTAVSALLALSKLLDDEQSQEIKSIIKAYSDSGSIEFIQYLTPYGIRHYQKDVEGNKKLSGKSFYGAFGFAAMDKLIVSNSKYSVALSISSDRTIKYETRPIRPEELQETYGAVNGKGWFSGDGMLLVYNPYYQIPDIYWDYVNYNRLPGTTVDSRDRTKYDTGDYNGINSYAGFATLGEFSVAANAMFNNNNEYISDLSAKKSWFIFDDEIVVLGAGINNTSTTNKEGHSIETIIENVYYGNNSSIIVDQAVGENTEIIPNNKSTVITNSALYLSKYGGIYVPQNKNDTVNARVNTTDGGNFIELWFDHGSTPTNATYEYALYPGATIPEFFDDYTSNNSITYEVYSNTDKVQAVHDISSDVTGYTFWEAASCNGVTTDFACNILVKETDTQIIIAISDFTHNAKSNSTGGTITLTGSHSLVSADAGLSFNANTITVDRTVAASGQTLTLVITK